MAQVCTLVPTIHTLITTLSMPFNLDLCCLNQVSSLLNLRMMFNTFLQPGAEITLKDNKSTAVVRQKLAIVSIRSAMLGWGRASPLRRTRWRVQGQTQRGTMYFNQVLLGGKAQLP